LDARDRHTLSVQFDTMEKVEFVLEIAPTGALAIGRSNGWWTGPSMQRSATAASRDTVIIPAKEARTPFRS
jgi:hypothetical protein